jgi:deoxyribodipyrimidine photolyase-related protein
LIITESGEFRLQQAIATTWSKQLQIPVQILNDDRFSVLPKPFATGLQIPKPYVWNFSTESRQSKPVT